MKRTILGAMMLVTFALGMMAQPNEKVQTSGKSGAYCRIPNLTEQQTQQIEKHRLEFQKKMNTMRAEMEKLRAEKHALMIAEKPDQKAIDATVDKMGTQRVAMQKEQVKYHLAVRSLLTDEQKVFFDQKASKFNKRKGVRKDYGPNGNRFNRVNCCIDRSK